MPRESEGLIYCGIYLPQYLQTRGALELILKLKINFLEKIISVHKLEQLKYKYNKILCIYSIFQCVRVCVHAMCVCVCVCV